MNAGVPIRFDAEAVGSGTGEHWGAPCNPRVILGYTIGNDVTAVDQVTADEKMTWSKNGDGFTPLGPWIETDLDPDDQPIEVLVDGVVRASSSTANLAWTIREQLVELTKHLTLDVGDVVLTGSPNTSCPASPGQVVSVRIPAIGTLTNPIA